ncbi:MAG: malonyl-CoA decarboxylase family protein [Deltaproteobacteria bacterium]|nr:malonyl-CoA decarboxylase family protein [Deltaproteobacteria bacterium]
MTDPNVSTQAPMKAPVIRLLRSFQKMGEEGSEESRLFQEIRSLYSTLSEQEKEQLFRSLIHEIEVSKEEINPLLDRMRADPQGDPDWPRLVSDLRDRIHSPRLNIFRKISHQPGGLKFLLDFRGDLLSARRFSTADLRPLDYDIVLLFELWFQDGFLFLEEITLDSSYRQIEIIKNSDLVHPMTSIEEMGRRLGRDRRCFALYHRLMPVEPVVFIEVALTKGIVRHISQIIGGPDLQEKPGEPDTAIFYSINNTQEGLAGLRLGKMLIGRVVDYLRKEREDITTFATLSPLPGFWRRYLKPVLEGKDQAFLLKSGEIQGFFSGRQMKKILDSLGPEGEEGKRFNEALLLMLSREDWGRDKDLRKVLQDPLLKLAYFYISREKSREGKTLNPVANFHLENGATVSKKNLNFLGNPSPRGLRDSCGIMVNYIYTAGWFTQIRSSLRRLEKVEMRGLFSRQR